MVCQPLKPRGALPGRSFQLTQHFGADWKQHFSQYFKTSFTVTRAGAKDGTKVQQGTGKGEQAVAWYQMEALGTTLGELTASKSKIAIVVKIELKESDADLISLSTTFAVFKQTASECNLSISLYNAKVWLLITLLKRVAIVGLSQNSKIKETRLLRM